MQALPRSRCVLTAPNPGCWRNRRSPPRHISAQARRALPGQPRRGCRPPPAPARGPGRAAPGPSSPPGEVHAARDLGDRPPPVRRGQSLRGMERIVRVTLAARCGRGAHARFVAGQAPSPAFGQIRVGEGSTSHGDQLCRHRDRPDHAPDCRRRTGRRSPGRLRAWRPWMARWTAGAPMAEWSTMCRCASPSHPSSRARLR